MPFRPSGPTVLDHIVRVLRRRAKGATIPELIAHLEPRGIGTASSIRNRVTESVARGRWIARAGVRNCRASGRPCQVYTLR